MLEEHAPEIGRFVTGAAAIEQAQPDPFLEFLDAAAQRGLRDAERFRGPAEAAVLGQRLRVAKQAKVDRNQDPLPEAGRPKICEFRMKPIAIMGLPYEVPPSTLRPNSPGSERRCRSPASCVLPSR
jgi:hypothetical protein